MTGFKLLVSHRDGAGRLVWSSLPVARPPETLTELAEHVDLLAELHEAHVHGSEVPPRSEWTWMARPVGFDGWPWYGVEP